MPEITCTCGKTFTTSKANLARGWGTHCSRSCANAARSNRRPIPDDAWPTIIASYQAGESIRSIETRLQAPTGSIRKGLTQHNIPIRDNHRSTLARYGHTQVASQPDLDRWGDQVLKAYYDGVPFPEIERTHGATKNMIDKMREDDSLPPR